MKYLIVAFLILAAFAAPANAQPLGSADWRSVANERDRDFIENWEKYFDEGVIRTRRALRATQHELSEDALRALKETTPVMSLQSRQLGHWPCRKIESVWFSTEILNWFGCRIARKGDIITLEKRSGSGFFAGKLYSDPKLGLIFIGYHWGNLEREGVYGKDSKRDAVGVLRRSGDRALRLLIVGDYRTTIVDIDQRWHIRE